VAARAEEVFPGRGSELMEAWRSRQFEYTWLRTVANRYVDFWTVTEEALVFAVRKLGLETNSSKVSAVMESYLGLKAWPEAADSLAKMKAAGLKLALLSNFTDKMLQAGLKNSGLAGTFDHVLSTDRAQAFKPDPRAYKLGTEAFGFRREQTAFAAAAGWDAAGAKWFGYPTVWLNRTNAPIEELGPKPDLTGKTLVDLSGFVLA
jgi:2-haloacid dehalogenase